MPVCSIEEAATKQEQKKCLLGEISLRKELWNTSISGIHAIMFTIK